VWLSGRAICLVTANNRLSSSREQYRYSSLPMRNVRLIRLHPGNINEHISCDLVWHPIDTLPDFEALSYTWGKPGIVIPICCDGSSLGIQSNAWYALHQLRSEYTAKLLWIDAICINQGDLQEKSLQLQLMKDIYSKATQVQVWLGYAIPGMELGFDPIYTLSALRASETVDAQRSTLNDENLGTLGLPTSTNVAWKALDYLLWETWFLRIWIIQELSLARTAIMMYRSRSCTWTQMQMAAHFILDHSLTFITGVDPSLVLRLEKLTGLAGKGTTAFELAQAARGSLATDLRDKIYGLLGLASDVQNIVPDYTLSNTEAYRRLALHKLAQSSDLEILNAVDHAGACGLNPKDFNARSRLPSWVPNWALMGPNQPLPATAQIDPFPLQYRISADQTFLITKGIHFDTVIYSGETFLDFLPRAGNANRLLVFLSPVNGLRDAGAQMRRRRWEILARKSPKPYPTGESKLAAYIRTIVANNLPGSNEELEMMYRAWTKYWDIYYEGRGKYLDYYVENSTPQERAHADLFLAYHQAAAYGRRFFVTKAGYFGLGPHDIKRTGGDCVVVLRGGRTAYMVRRAGVVNGQETWQVRGEVYLHGLDKGVLGHEARLREFVLG
jgi:hypothetical protein